MMFNLLNMYTCLLFVSVNFTKAFSFQPDTKKIPSTRFKYVGDTQPIGYFDPLGISSKVSEERLKYFREAELQHGRIAMLASLIVPALEITQNELGINVMTNSPLDTQYAYLFGFSIFELARMLKGYENPFIGSEAFQLKDAHEPGQIFPTSVFKYELSVDRMNKELNNGRLAMLAMAHVLGFEYFYHVPVYSGF